MFKTMPSILILAMILLALPMTVGNAFAKDVIAMVTANEAIIHTGPSSDAPIVGKIQRSGIVMVTEVKGPWVHVFWMKDNQAQNGWVLGESLRVMERGGGSGGSYTSSGGANFRLSVRDTELNCREGFDGGYSSCEVSISLQYDSDYNGNDSPNVNVECDVELTTTDQQSFTNRKSESETATYYGKSGGGEIEVSFSLTAFDPIVQAKVTDVSCRIQDVY